MALTQIQTKLTALFAVVEKTVQTHYLDRFTAVNPEFLSENETINIKDLNDFLVEASIIERGSEIDYIKINGIDTTTVTPDIVAASYPLKPIMPTSTVTLINGQEISEQDFEEDRLLLKLKNAMLRTKEKQAANMFLTGKYLQKKSGTEINYNFKAAEKLDAREVNNWVTLFFDLIEKYEIKNGIYPDRIELGKTLFEKIIKNNEFINIAKSYSNSIGLSSAERQIYLDLLGQKISKLKGAMDFNDKEINVNNYIYLSHDAALVAGYAALEAVDEAGNPYVLRGTEIIDQTKANKETARAKMFGKSGFTPIVALKDLIVRYEVINVEAIKIVGEHSELGAVADYFLGLSVEAMTKAISKIDDKNLLSLMLSKENRTTGKQAIEDRLGAL
jgi:hypothetical protein|nr:MAG TPA: Putative capsid protein of prophage protein, prophage, structural genomics.2A [Caudoviricetes sp.]